MARQPKEPTSAVEFRTHDQGASAKATFLLSKFATEATNARPTNKNRAFIHRVRVETKHLDNLKEVAAKRFNGDALTVKVGGRKITLPPPPVEVAKPAATAPEPAVA